MRLAVDSARETANHDEACCGQLPAKHARDLGAIGRARTRPDDRHRRVRKHLHVSRPAEKESPWWIVDLPEQLRQVAAA